MIIDIIFTFIFGPIAIICAYDIWRYFFDKNYKGDNWGHDWF